ncbi:DNA/RNA nuclease SfsA [Halothermothrix orenii]|uniref:Sugar fermentation stimulation protein homolog n=1 Tax=Halothermothrix orenii (strain H 168 / OCM 544 / DSM 9562) TaxID=373903 RepID=B8D2E6_HALOH|nr:DNA/RNA nuclease SfsA [Halothermothrix orenii]ACL69373.1 sugar fermentation stimulation protein [Halothermothrix orenii H 168]
MIRKAFFIKRLNRFAALVSLMGEEEKVFVPNSGRMKELLIRGTPVLLKKVISGQRKTKYDLIKVYHNSRWVSIDSRVPNRIFSDAIKKGRVTDFKGFKFGRQEVRWGNSRLDMLLVKKDVPVKYYLELKSVTLVEGDIARFPDAPTERGRRHLRELTDCLKKGHKAGIVFIVQRDDARFFSPNDKTDPEFGKELRRALKAGVNAFAYTCRVDEKSIKIDKKINILL